MKILALRADNSGCAQYRIKEPVAAACAIDGSLDVTIDTTIGVVGYQDVKTKFTRIDEVLTDADLIIIQRPLNQWFTSLIEQAHRQGITVVVELDDDFENAHRQNTVWSNLQPDLHPESNYEWVKRACNVADLVTVSTPALARYARHTRVAVIPNYITRAHVSTHTIGEPPGPVRIGWSGTTQTHPTDLQVTGSAVNQVLRDTRSQFVTVGDPVGVQAALGLARSLPFVTTKWVESARFMETLAHTMDIGIVPLDSIPFNEAKSALKGLEYAAVGVPFVASPTAAYLSVAADGIGEIAHSASEWRRLLTRLVQDHDRRIGLAEAYRARVMEQYVLEDHAHEWVSAWHQAVDNRKRSAAA